VLSPVIIGVSSLGTARELLLDAPLLHVDPIRGGHPEIAMSLVAVLVTVVAWPLIAATLGAWRTRTMDA
jgi:hypothetical protein